MSDRVALEEEPFLFLDDRIHEIGDRLPLDDQAVGHEIIAGFQRGAFDDKIGRLRQPLDHLERFPMVD